MPFHPMGPMKYESKVFTHYPSFISGEVCDELVNNKDKYFKFHPKGDNAAYRGIQNAYSMTADVHTPYKDSIDYIKDLYKELCPEDMSIGWINLSVYNEGRRLVEHTDTKSTLTIVSTLTDGDDGGNFAIDGKDLILGKGDDKAGATATTYANAEDFIHYDTALAANTLDRTTGIVVGPGQNVLVYSGSADVAYSVSGFESASDD